MADKKLNEVTKVTDMAYVPVIMADGSIGQIAKADLASVVAEQILGGYVKRIEAHNNNKSSLSINVRGLAPEGIPLKWELYGGQWEQKAICYAEGVCRIYGEYGHAIVSSNESVTPAVTMDNEGLLTINFGVKLSYARVFVYSSY